MGTWLIVQGRWMVTDRGGRMGLSDCPCGEAVPGNSLHISTVPETDTGGLAEHA